MKDMDEKRALTNRSNHLLEALRQLRTTEKRKRDEPISTPKFHQLADDVEEISRRIFSIARQEEQLGDEAPRGDVTINDIDRRDADRPRSN
jgi:hypothetical protein